MTTTTASSRKTPRGPDLDRGVAMTLAADEYARAADTLDRLTPEQWTVATDCAGWDVRAMAGHMLGMAQMAASLPESIRQQRAAGQRAKRDGGPTIDALTALQVEKNARLSPAELVREFRRVGPKAAKARRRTPSFVRSRTMPEAQPVGEADEWWTFGFLFDVILTRDPFMHRIDIARATGDPMTVTPEHEGVIVDDVVREWAGRHGQAYDLELTGLAGGHWSEGTGGEQLRLDALDFCRALSGRGEGPGLLAVQVPF